MLFEVGVGMSCVYKLNSVGKIVEPCGVPSLIVRIFEEVPLKKTCAVLPDK